MNAQTSPEVRCEALTVKKVQCKNGAVEGTTYCTIHDPNSPRCGAPTTKKTPCKMRVTKAGEKCWRHID
jgi:hypothetical protein